MNEKEKLNQLLNVSNPVIVKEKLNEYLKKNNINNEINLYMSNRKNKKYMIMNTLGKVIHFGDINFSDHTKHKDDLRREKYLKRAMNIKGNWKDNIFSPNSLSINLLW
jgi:hypothetical protein